MGHIQFLISFSTYTFSAQNMYMYYFAGAISCPAICQGGLQGTTHPETADLDRRYDRKTALFLPWIFWLTSFNFMTLYFNTVHLCVVTMDVFIYKF